MPKKKGNGRTPADLARDKGHAGIARYLDGRRPLAEKGVRASFRDALAPGACLYFCAGGATPESVRWPWFVMVFNKILAQMLYVFKFFGPNTVPPAGVPARALGPGVPAAPPWVHAVGFQLQLCAWVFFLLTWRGDPGDLGEKTAHGGLRRAYDAYFDGLVRPGGAACAGGGGRALCHSCHIVKPPRSKHCRVRRTCVATFDHYCPYVGNTVGLYNYRWFVLYCLSFTLAALHWEVLAYARARAGGGDMLLYVSAAWFALFVAFGLAMLAYHAQLLAICPCRERGE